MSADRQAFLAWAATLTDPPADEPGPYRGHAVTMNQLAGLVERGLEPERIGTSSLGQPLWVFVAGATTARSTTFVMAGLHAMEHVGVATAVALLEQAVAADSPWSGQRLVVLPLANPDGFLAVCTSLAAGRRRFLRHNARGVDLNRNFAAFWDDRYYLNRLLPGVFSSGPAPLSEPEAQAIDATLARFRPNHAVSLHAFGRWIFVPYAGSRAVPRDLDRMLELARGMAACQPAPYRVQQLGRRSRLFLACGAEIDHMYERHGALSFLVEIGNGPRLLHPSTWLDPYRWFTPPAAQLERDIAEVLPALAHLGRA